MDRYVENLNVHLLAHNVDKLWIDGNDKGTAGLNQTLRKNSSAKVFGLIGFVVTKGLGERPFYPSSTRTTYR